MDTDIALMKLIKKGDEKAFEVLYARHQRSVFNLCLRFLGNDGDAEDATQESFVRVYQAAGTYRPDAKFTTWLYTIVKNHCFNLIRKKKAADVISMEDETVPEIPSRDDDQVTMLSRTQIKQRVELAVNSLPENMRIAVILQKFEGLTCEEVADILGCSVNAIKLRVHRAKEILARQLGDLREETK